MTQDTKALLEGGFGDRTYRANGLTVFVNPSKHENVDGSTSITIGFPFLTIDEHVADPEDVAKGLAEYLSRPVSLTTRAETAEAEVKRLREGLPTLRSIRTWVAGLPHDEDAREQVLNDLSALLKEAGE